MMIKKFTWLFASALIITSCTQPAEETNRGYTINGTIENAEDLQTIYHNTIAEKFAYEKRFIVKELESKGIYGILTKPKNLTVNVINKYL